MTPEAEELILAPPPEPKQNRHIVVALNHLHKRRLVLQAQCDRINREIDDIDEAISALK